MIENFKKIGEYTQPNKNPSYINFIGRTKTKRQSLVYLFVVDQEIKYIGETRQGFVRPLSYNKNKVMEFQRKSILEETSSGNKVEVYAYLTSEIKQSVNGMELDIYIAQDYEKALIKKYDPEWNKRA